MIGSLFTGYGGLDMAAEKVTGLETGFFSDISPGACKFLASRRPDVPNLGDITQVDWTPWIGIIRVITGGFPCQDLSSAGAQVGMSGARSGLWTEMHRAIKQLEPELVIIENVRGLLSASAVSSLEPCPWCLGDKGEVSLRALGAVLGDLADIGYDARWKSVRASDIGTCHQRERVFIVAERSGRPWPGATLAHARLKNLTMLPTPIASDGAANGHPFHRMAGGHMVNLSSIAFLTELELSTIFEDAFARHARLVGRPAPPHVVSGGKHNLRLNVKFVEWMMCLPEGLVTEAEGVTRGEASALLGNGVVPPQAVLALELLGVGKLAGVAS